MTKKEAIKKWENNQLEKYRGFRGFFLSENTVIFDRKHGVFGKRVNLYFSMAALHQEIEQHHSCKQTKNESLACSSVSVSKILSNNHSLMFYEKLLIDHHEHCHDHRREHQGEPTNELLSFLLIQLHNNHLDQ